ncbi:hypothetical protein [Granulosicoccus antarcticus]|uniref:Uncharacterized protein n=1 Tax=Granulosicoccus antarcticus IMCC3135 TaxID=1192854 RepID=A0A2Z2PA01_9GAMM|nr:hypothetical protein [Granulosicoccus antarcticus]ASJ76714.1 hypothetical protein IMCC3135_33350 [Granulosicoccus antarcticus IMCC3135]
MQTLINREPLGKGSLALAALAAAIAIWLLMGAIPESAFSQTAGWTAEAGCQNEADVLAAADRSRNGISASCNLETLNRARAER